MSKEENKKNTKEKNKPKATKKINNKKDFNKKENKITKDNMKETKVVDKVEIKEIEKVEETKNTTEKIKKIEEKTKKKMPKSPRSKKESFIEFLTKVDEKRKIIYGFIGGLLLGLLIMMIFMPDRIATLKDGTQPVAKIDGKNITANELYEDMKNFYSVSVLLDKIDTKILTKLYEENDEMLDKVNTEAENYLKSYEEYYGDTEEEFLERNGFSNYQEFIDYLKLAYRRTEYVKDYLKDSLTDKEIEKYYEENVFGDINCEHVLVTVGSGDNSLSDEDAKKLAEEIIKKINDGTTWDEIKKEYKDKVTYENLSYQSWDASLEKSFMDALKDMKDNSFSKQPVKTSYGYHVIHRLDQKKTPSLKKAKETIIENLIAEKQSKDENISYKALIALRKEHKLEFSDTNLKAKYDSYCKKYK